MEEPPIAEEDMSANQKRKAEAAKIKQETEQREKQAALERKRKEEERLKQEKEQKEREEHVKMLENIFKGMGANQDKQEPETKAANFEDIMKEQAQSVTKKQQKVGPQKKDPNVIHFDYLNPSAKLPDSGKASVAEVATVVFEESKKGGKKPTQKKK